MEVDRRTRKRDRTRQALLSAALALFSEKGIYEPSIEEITTRADVGKGTFYQYFPSREVLVAELVRDGFVRLLAEVEVGVRGVPGEEDSLPAILEAHRAFFQAHPEYLLLFHQARGWMKMARHHGEALPQAFSEYVGQLGLLMGEPSWDSSKTPSRRAIVLAGFIGGVLSFEKTLGIEDSPLGLSEDLMLLSPASQSTRINSNRSLPKRRL